MLVSLVTVYGRMAGWHRGSGGSGWASDSPMFSEQPSIIVRREVCADRYAQFDGEGRNQAMP